MAISNTPQTPPSADYRLGPGTHWLDIPAAGHLWQCAVHVPAAYDGRRALPWVWVLHGAGGTAQLYLDNNGWAAQAERESFIVVVPHGLPAMPDRPPDFRRNPRLWNTGLSRSRAARSQIDDAQFFSTLLSELPRRLNLDLDRGYVTGHSNGAGMTFRLAHEFSEHFAAIAPVASPCWIEQPWPARPLPTLYVIGTADPLVPLAGGETMSPWGKRALPPIEQTIQRWAAALGCAQLPTSVRVEAGVQFFDYGPGREGVPFTVCFVEGQGHGWPGGRSEGLPSRMIGPRTSHLKATNTIWHFFNQWSRK